MAIVGASGNRRKFGNKAVRAFADSGWTVFPIHPSEAQIEGQRCYDSLEALTATPDVVSIYVPPEVARGLLPEIAKLAPEKVIFNPGVDEPQLLEQAAALGINVVATCSIVDIGRSPAEFGDE